MIFITGCARSGTSLVAGIVDRCEGWGGDICGATRYNPRGQYENVEIRNSVIKPVLRMIGADPMGQHPLPDMQKILKLLNGFSAETRRTIDRIIKKQGYKDRKPWYFKGAKICLIWPIWMRAYPEAQYIVVQRPDHLIIKSCMRTAFMRKRSTKEQWQEWIDFHKERFDEMEAYLPDNVHRIDSLEIVNGNLDKIEYLVKKLHLVWKRDAVEDFIDKKIWNTKK